MGLCKVRLFPIKEINPNDYPAYNMPFKLCSSDDENINNISVTINNKVKEKTLQADDQESVSRVVTGYEGEIQAYGLDADATTNLFGYQKNADGNVVDVVNAINTTGARLRPASIKELIKCKLPGPQDPAQAVGLLLISASAPAAKPPASSCLIWIHCIFLL